MNRSSQTHADSVNDWKNLKKWQRSMFKEPEFVETGNWTKCKWIDAETLNWLLILCNLFQNLKCPTRSALFLILKIMKGTLQDKLKNSRIHSKIFLNKLKTTSRKCKKFTMFMQKIQQCSEYLTSMLKFQNMKEKPKQNKWNLSLIDLLQDTFWKMFRNFTRQALCCQNLLLNYFLQWQA